MTGFIVIAGMRAFIVMFYLIMKFVIISKGDLHEWIIICFIISSIRSVF